MTELQEEFGTDELVVLYYHVNDPYATPETHNRAAYFQVGGIPEVDFDAVSEVIGAGENADDVYRPIINARLGESTPITLRTEGIIYAHDAPDSSWVTTVFKAVDTIPPEYGDLVANFIVYENTSEVYPWTVRDMLATASITTLDAPGDSVVVTRRFTASPTWDLDELHVAVFLEDTSPKVIVNAQIMPDPYDNVFHHTDHYAVEIDYMGEAISHTVLTNTGIMPDTINVDIAHTIVPDGLGPYDWIAFYCDTGGACHYGPWDYVLQPGESETLDVHVLDVNGTIQGMALTTVTATSQGDTTVVSSEAFATFVDLPSILLVDDDGGDSYETHLQTALEDTGYTARVWDTSAGGRPSLTRLESYWAVLWTTANGDVVTLGGEDQNNLMTYLDGGGNLLLTSMNYLSSRVDTSAFITDYLHIDSWTNDAGGFIMSGIGGDAISEGMSLNLLSGPFPPNDSDTFVSSSPADVIFSSPAGNEGLRVEENDHKVVFLSFPFELVKTTEAYPDNQKTLISRILNWFQLPSGIEDAEVHRLALRQNYPNPFNPVTKVAFTVPAGGGHVVLTVHNVGGQVVRTLVDETLPAGPALAVWDGRDEAGGSLASGVYFARLSAGGEAAFRKMTLLK